MIPITPHTTTIEEVIDQLGRIVAWARQHDSALGYFASLYRQVTIRVAEGIEMGRFSDGPRMEGLDVAFANRYFEALALYAQGEKPTQAWQVAFDTAQHKRVQVLQHLFLGMNAHINLDLGIAAGTYRPGDAIAELEEDFMEINLLLAEMVDEVQERINQLSPLWGAVDRLGGDLDERLAEFALRQARQVAWKLARDTAACPSCDHHLLIERVDRQAAKFGELVLQPPGWLRLLSWLSWLLERKRNQRIYAALEGPVAQYP